MRVLLIEDNPGDAELVREMLKEASGNVTLNVVEKLGTGLKFLGSQDIDVVLLDLGLPDSHGLETLSTLQMQFSHLPVVIMTGSNDEALGNQAVQIGAQDYLVKGQIDGRLLQRALVYAIERKQAEGIEQAIEEWRTTFDSITELVSIHSKDYKLLKVNRAFADSLNMKPEELIGKTCYEVIHGTTEPVSGCPHMKTLKIKEPAMGEFFEPHLGIYLEVSTSPIFDDKGEVVASVHVARDTTERKRAEETLRERDEFTTSLLDNAPNPIAVTNPDTSLRYINPALQKLTGYSKAELIGSKPPFPFWPKDKREQYGRDFRQEMLGGLSREEMQFQKKNGELFWIERTTVNIRSEGKLRYRLTNWLDITERKRAVEQYRLLAEHSADIIYKLEIATERYTYVSPSVERLLGYSASEALLLQVKDVLTPESYQKQYEAMTADISHRRISPETLQLEALHKDGHIVPVEVNASFILDTNGNPVEIVGVARDITERKRAEERIERAASEWRTTFDSITELVSIHSKDYKLLRVNKAFADSLKMKPEELIGKTCYEMFHGTNEPVSGCPHMKTLKTREPARGEFFEPHLGIYLEVSTSPIFDDKGEVVASVHVTRDVTERKKMQEQLMVTDRLASIGMMASGVAHELNNPLTGVIGFSELLLEKDLPEDIKEDLTTINKEARRTANVVKGLLTFARKQGTEKTLVDINSIIQGVWQIRAYEQRVSNIGVTTSFAPDLPHVMGNGAQLQQVFINIIVNAEQAMIEAHGRGKLDIITERVGNMVRASITDDGPGISPENMRKLFTPFFTTKEVGKGTGLGLSICHGIINEHGGRIYAESELGKGTTFIIELPVKQASEEASK